MADPKTKKFSRTSDIEDFKIWLATLGAATPKLHVNGPGYSMAVITVDFGTPLDESGRITSEQNAELMSRMKTLTRSLHKTEVNVRIQNDTNNGIWWTTVA